MLAFSLKKIYKNLTVNLKKERGTSLISYAMLLSLLALICIPSINYFTQNIGESLCDSATVVEYGQNSPTNLEFRDKNGRKECVHTVYYDENDQSHCSGLLEIGIPTELLPPECR